jgi:hypothetical protein
MPTKTNERPDGPAAAALRAGGIGSAVFGLITLFSEVSAAFGKSLNWYSPVGALTGKSILGVATFLVAWAILHYAWKAKDTNFGSISRIALALLVVGLIGTFPPFWHLFPAM